MSQLTVRPIRTLNAEIQVPGDKSISHRAAMFASFASGTSYITGFLPSEDCLYTVKIMRALGAHIDRVDETTLIIEGCNGRFLKPAEALDCGNSGTSMRLIAGLLAGQPFEATLFGDASLSRRPMKRVVEPLEKLGAHVTCKGESLRPPITIKGGHLKGITYKTPVPSAQVKSCVLLAGLQAEGKTTVEEDLLTRNHTEQMLRHFHASVVQEKKNTVTVYGNHPLNAENVNVPGDFSSAAFWLVAAGAFPGARVVLPNVGLNPTRTGLLTVLTRMGVNITEQVHYPGAEPMGSLIIQEGTLLRSTEIGGAEIPNVIDELPILAVAGALAEGVTVIRDAAELRVKETDRIAALAANLRAFGVEVEETPDGLAIQGRCKLRGARVSSFGDHRIAMAFAILGLFAKGETIIDDAECIPTSYPSFERDFARVMANKPVVLNSVNA